MSIADENQNWLNTPPDGQPPELDMETAASSLENDLLANTEVSTLDVPEPLGPVQRRDVEATPVLNLPHSAPRMDHAPIDAKRRTAGQTVEVPQAKRYAAPRTARQAMQQQRARAREAQQGQDWTPAAQPPPAWNGPAAQPPPAPQPPPAWNGPAAQPPQAAQPPPANAQAGMGGHNMAETNQKLDRVIAVLEKIEQKINTGFGD